MKQNRNRESLQEIEQALKIKISQADHEHNLIDAKSLLRRAQIMLNMSNFESSESEARRLLETLQEPTCQVLEGGDKEEISQKVQQLIKEIKVTKKT